MTDSDTQTIERPDADVDTQTDDGTGGEANKEFHYVRKTSIVTSVVEGGHVVALCGEVFPVTKAAQPGSPVCAECTRLFEQLRP